MEELLKKLEAEFDEAEGWIRIVGADWFADDLRINLSLLLHEDAEPELWEISCTGTVEESLTSEFSETISVSSSSPLLCPFIEPEVELMFSDNTCSPSLVLGVVCTSCVELMERAEYIQRFTNQSAIISGIVSSRYGMLGRFPESVAERIVQLLSGHPINIKALPGRMPAHWNGSEFIPYPKLKALKIGSSYIIAESYHAIRA